MTDEEWKDMRASFAAVDMEPPNSTSNPFFYSRSWALDIPLETWKQFFTPDPGAFPVQELLALLPADHPARQWSAP